MKAILLLVAVLAVGVLVTTILLRGSEPPRPVFTGDGITAPPVGSTTERNGKESGGRDD